jgi:hypothetical protein
VQPTKEQPAAEPPHLPKTLTREERDRAETIEKLALRIWVAIVAEKTLDEMSKLFDELIDDDPYLDADDDEEKGEGEDWVGDHRRHEAELLEKGIDRGLEKYPNFDAINAAPKPAELKEDAEKLAEEMMKAAIGGEKFEDKFSREALQRLVRSGLKELFKKNEKYTKHVRNELPGKDSKMYGSKRCTTSKGTFVKAPEEFVNGGGLGMLLSGGWIRVARDRVDPYALSHEYSPQRKTSRKNWRRVYRITEKDGRSSFLDVPAEKLAGTGTPAVKHLTKAGVNVIHRAWKALVVFLHYRPRLEIVRMPHVGWFEVEGHWIFVRPDEVFTPPGMPAARNTIYVIEATSNHGLHIEGKTPEWMAEVAEPVRGNSNVALAFATFFAAPLLRFANETGGGFHLAGLSTAGKSFVSALGQSINGWPYETADHAFGMSWGGSEAGSIAFFRDRSDLGVSLDEITLSDPKTAQDTAYRLAAGTEGPRATATGKQRDTAHASILGLSTGEKTLEQFVGKILQEGASKRLSSVPAVIKETETAFETVRGRTELHAMAKRLYAAMKRCHGAVGRDWQCHLVKLGHAGIDSALAEHRGAFLGLPEVAAIAERAHPTVQQVINRFALYAAALRMAIAAGLLPWTVAEADAGIVACMQRWLGQRGNIDVAGEILRAARDLEARLEAAMVDRYIHLAKDAKGRWAPATATDEAKAKTPDLYDGYVKGDRVLVRPETWQRLCAGHDGLTEHLKTVGKLIPDKDGKASRKERVHGNKLGRYYVLAIEPSHRPTVPPQTKAAKTISQ